MGIRLISLITFVSTFSFSAHALDNRQLSKNEALVSSISSLDSIELNHSKTSPLEKHFVIKMLINDNGLEEYLHRYFVDEHIEIPNWKNWSLTSFSGATLNETALKKHNDLSISLALNYRF
ncbi:hypothetical protein AB4343_16915 [Vibrio breoganii]|uniref:hypothetical protein n=1 Tax=Vibrio breoganii TaxID=553239 RepID=UPI000C838692|nr:hypothetical protein [Vibrio breoganii]PMG03343.1 hypothetical protein BCV08_06950 [Vibrio breoganii]PMH13509.1 hypothetical protein BCU74_16320 [Vibrio breoganii]PMK49736.1 hypothetical protein BCT98_17865 [Vibrio breoganii]PMM12581.1 hypothetical protein BCT60_15125 [Vibrio breoganii]PMP06549.1 hypothetical protein BCS94_11530 [Vibrio breoganii]